MKKDRGNEAMEQDGQEMKTGNKHRDGKAYGWNVKNKGKHEETQPTSILLRQTINVKRKAERGKVVKK